MAIRCVTRNIEIDFLDIPQAPGYAVVFARWEGEQAFKWAIVERQRADMWMTSIVDPVQVEHTTRLMPHLKGKTRKEWPGRPMLIKSRGVDLFRKFGYPFGKDDDVKCYEPKKWMQSIVGDFQLVFWCLYDHTLLDKQGNLITGAKIVLVSDDSDDMSKLDDLVKNSSGKFTWLYEEHYYVRGNGMSNNIVVHFTDEEYVRLKTNTQSMSSLWDLCHFFGYDYKEFKAPARKR